MKNSKILLFLFAIVAGSTSIAQKYTNTDSATITKSWNGNSFSSSKTFVENIAEVSSFSMLKRALEDKSIVKAIEAEEMVTLFAISNKGFQKYQEIQDSIFSPANAEKLTAIIKYHSIPGRVDSYSLKKAIARKGGTIYYATLEGEKLGVKEENGQLFLVDSKGNTSLISATDFYHKNGFFHIVDGIVFPN